MIVESSNLFSFNLFLFQLLKSNTGTAHNEICNDSVHCHTQSDYELTRGLIQENNLS
jgi:hypothetical protein